MKFTHTLRSLFRRRPRTATVVTPQRPQPLQIIVTTTVTVETVDLALETPEPPVVDCPALYFSPSQPPPKN
ncbi:hypothetical protein D9756_007594 [Leucocoprinus leucothites]|uniref:Uncharacterized protein n=1 Tax=Leucocoprinus leucothites TaxID=201217 RepID=A0A8H5D1P5_9AGAR|nr:hypothetical protein D9756_007594 [Leucoagaricus leucothites]